MSVAWSLTRANGETRTLEAWGIRSAIRRLVNQGLDTLDLGFGAADLLGNLPFDPDETVIISRDGATYFRGRIITEKRGAYGSAEGLTLTLAGPWWYLQKIIYTQPAKFVTDGTANPDPADPAGLASTDFNLVTKATAQVILNDQGGVRVDARAMVLDALNFAIAKGAPIAIGTVDPSLAVSREELRDATCAEVIGKSLRWVPDQTAWWDYSVNPPALSIRSRANRPLLALDIAAGNVSQVELNPRRDLSIAGVTINYVRHHQRTNFEFLTLDSDLAGPSPAGLNALVVTVELYGSYLIQTAVGPPPVYAVIAQEAAPVGIAATLYNNYSVIPYEGRIVLVGDDVAATVWLSQSLRVLGGAPAWATAIMDIQQSSDDLFAGRTELTIGPPRQLGPTDLIGLVRKGRTAPPPNVLDRGGGSPNTPAFPANTPDPRLKVAPPKPPDPPHNDVDPGTYTTQRTGHSGSYNTADSSIDCGPPSTGFPNCPNFDLPLGASAAEPAYNTVIANESTFGASLSTSNQISVSAGPLLSSYTYSYHHAASGNYSDWTFDFRTLSASNCIGIQLVGTKTVSQANGVDVTTEERIDLSGSIGGIVSKRATAPLGVGKWDGLTRSAEQHGSVSFPTLRIYTPVA